MQLACTHMPRIAADRSVQCQGPRHLVFYLLVPVVWGDHPGMCQAPAAPRHSLAWPCHVQDVDEGEAIASVHEAFNLGINFFDTSPFYGATKSETILGKALVDLPRDQIVVATKVGRYGPEEFDFSAERVTRSLHESLGRLQLQYVDIVQCHDIEFGDLAKVRTPWFHSHAPLDTALFVLTVSLVLNFFGSGSRTHPQTNDQLLPPEALQRQPLLSCMSRASLQARIVVVARATAGTFQQLPCAPLPLGAPVKPGAAGPVLMQCWG
jgi:hypothetical protein